MPPQLKKRYGVRMTDPYTGKAVESIIELTTEELTRLLQRGATADDDVLTQAGYMPRPKRLQ